MPIAVITIGIPASGKSTYAKLLVQQGFAEINLDDCRRSICGDASNQNSTQEAVKLHKEKLNQAIFLGRDVVISDTNLNPFFRYQLINQLLKEGYEVRPVLFNEDFDVCMERNRKRNQIVPEHAMIRMYKSLKEQFYI